MAAFSSHFEKWLNDTLSELRRLSATTLKSDSVENQYFGSSESLHDSCIVEMSTGKSQYGGSSQTNGGWNVTNGGLSSKNVSASSNKHRGGFDPYQFTYDQDEALDFNDDDADADVIMSPQERVAVMLGGKSEPEEVEPPPPGSDFWEVPNGEDPAESNENFEPNFDFRCSASSLGFSDDDELDSRSVTSEPKSFAEHPDLTSDFRVEDVQFVQIERSNSHGKLHGSLERGSMEKQRSGDVKALGSGTRLMGLFGSRGKGKASPVDNGFTVRYTKAGDTVEEGGYIDDDYKPVGMTQEEVDESFKKRSSEGILPLPSVDLAMDSEVESMLDCGSVDGRYGSFKGSRTDDTAVLTKPDQPARWSVRHRRAIIGVSAIAALALLAIICAVVYFILRFNLII